MLTELGNRLKEARLAKGFSLDDLQEMTKIQKRYLVGIEEGNYSIMPGSFYVRAFIKQYSEAVGLNANEILDQYQGEIPNSQVKEVAQSFSQSSNRRKMTKSSSRNKTMEAMPKVIVALFAIVIIVVIVALVSKKMSEAPSFEADENPPFEFDKKPVTADPVEEEEADEEQPEKEPIEEVVDQTPVQTIAPGIPLSDGASFEYTVSGTDKLMIKVEVLSGRSWVGIRNAQNNEQITAREYASAEIVEFDATANNYARIRLGRALNVKVYVNDEEVPYVSDAVTQNIILKLEQEQTEQ